MFPPWTHQQSWFTLEQQWASLSHSANKQKKSKWIRMESSFVGPLCAAFQLTLHMFTLNHVISLTQWSQTSTTVLVWLLLSYNNTTFRFSNFAVKSGLSELSWCSYLSPDSVTIASLQLWVYHWGRLASIYKTHLHFFRWSSWLEQLPTLTTNKGN